MPTEVEIMQSIAPVEPDWTCILLKAPYVQYVWGERAFQVRKKNVVKIRGLVLLVLVPPFNTRH